METEKWRVNGDPGYVFPAIRGIQARREYYVTMCPMRLLPRLFLFDDEELLPELRAQRHLNKARIPELSRYLVGNADDYVFSAITASIDAQVEFEQISDNGIGNRMGKLHIPLAARFIINDGQHRRAAIERALRERPELGDETIAVVFFVDLGLARCQQMFADLNRYAVRPSKSLSILYDYRDETAMLAKALVARSPVFRNVVELERTALSERSRHLFTLSAIYQATGELVDGLDPGDPRELADLALSFWEALASCLKEWDRVRRGELTSGELRSTYIHSHGVVLQALGRAGGSLIRRYPEQWRVRLASLGDIDWRRANGSLWEGRAMSGGRISRGSQNVVLTANFLKSQLGLELAAEEQRAEDAFGRRNHVEQG